MKPKQFLILSAIASVLIITGCAPVYVPTAVNSPMLSNKGEVQIVVNAGTSGIDPQLSVALSDHIGIMANGSFMDEKSDSSDDFHNHKFGELGLGYYTKIGDKGRFEVFGGFGIGNLKTKVSSNSWWGTESDVRYNKVFMQPAIGLTSKVFDFSFASRFVMVNYYQDAGADMGFFWEPVFSFKVGYKYVKAIIQVGPSITLNKNNFHFNYQPVIISLGLQATLNRRWD